MRAGMSQSITSRHSQQPWCGGVLARHSHQNNNPANEGALWDVVRAIQSNKMHYLTQLLALWKAGDHFERAFPDLSPASGGMYALAQSTWLRAQAEVKLKSAMGLREAYSHEA